MFDVFVIELSYGKNVIIKMDISIKICKHQIKLFQYFLWDNYFELSFSLI